MKWDKALSICCVVLRCILLLLELAADKQHYDVAKEALNVVRIARGLDKYSGTDAGLADEIQQEKKA